MPRVWFYLKRSLHCESETSGVHDPKSKNHLTAISTRRPGRRSGCSRTIANLKDVINGGSSRRYHFDKPPSYSPRSIGSSEFLNPITHEVILSNTTSELKISGVSAAASGGVGSTFVGTLKPGTPFSFRNGASSTPRKSSPLLISDSEGGLVTSRRFSIEVDSNGYYSSASCCKCGEKLSKWEDAESHHVSKHAVTELVEGDSSRKIVEIICRTSWMKAEKNCSRIMDKVLKVHNTQQTLARFEEYRDSVKMRASNLHKKHPRCLADGNELLRFYATTLSCSLGSATNTICNSDNCSVCRIIRNGFSVKEEVNNGNGNGIYTASTSGRALESVDDDGGGDERSEEEEKKKKKKKKKKVLIVCRVIAGRVHRPLENVKDMVGIHSGFDSLAGKLGIYSNMEELYLLNPSSLLPCFVVICKP